MSVGATGAGAGTSAGASGAAASGAAPAAATGASGAAPAAAASGAAAAPAAAQATPSDWTTGLNDDMKGYVQNKGWKDPGQVADGYRNLEKLLGAPQDQIIRMAKEDDAAGWDSIYTRLGRPATPEGYKIEAPKEGGNPEFAKWASSEFHKLGLSEKQGRTLAEAFNNYSESQVQAQKEQSNAKLAGETDGLKKEWGAAYNQNIDQAKRAAREFGVEPGVIDGLEKQVGFAATMKFFQTIGSKLGESSYVAGNGSASGSGNGPMTPAQAQSQISALKADPSFVKKYISGDVSAREKMQRLHMYAHPESA